MSDSKLAEFAAIAVTVTGSSLVFFTILKRLGLLRVSVADELKGLDMPELGTEGYPKDWEPAPEAIPSGMARPVGGLAAAPGD